MHGIRVDQKTETLLFHLLWYLTPDAGDDEVLSPIAHDDDAHLYACHAGDPEIDGVQAWLVKVDHLGDLDENDPTGWYLFRSPEGSDLPFERLKEMVRADLAELAARAR